MQKLVQSFEHATRQTKTYLLSVLGCNISNLRYAHLNCELVIAVASNFLNACMHHQNVSNDYIRVEAEKLYNYAGRISQNHLHWAKTKHRREVVFF